MSRSTRKPWYIDGFKGSSRKQAMKRVANRRIRHAQDVPNGKAYRKFFDPWNICDYRFRYDPKPHVCFRKDVFTGVCKQVIYEPDPIWRVARK